MDADDRMTLPQGLEARFTVDHVFQDVVNAGVFRVRDADAGGAPRILKVVSCGSGAADRLAAEFALLENVRHPNLTEQLEYGRSDDAVWLLREYVDGGTLASPPTGLDQEGRRGVLIDVLRGLAHLQGRGALHLDVKPQNVLLRRDASRSSGRAGRWRGVLSDFGFAAAARSDDGTARGTPPFVAPEVVLGQPRDGRADLFSFGVTWIAASDRLPPIDVGRLYESFPRRSFVDALGLDLAASEGTDAPVLARCLATDPDDRFRSAAEVLHALGAHEEAPDELEALLAPDPVAVEEARERLVQLVEERTPESSWIDVPSRRERDAIERRLRFLAARTAIRVEVVDAPEDLTPAAVESAVFAARGGVVAVVVHGEADAGRTALFLRARDKIDDAPALLVLTVRGAGLGEDASARLASGVGPMVRLVADGRAARLRQLVRLEGRSPDEPPPARLDALAAALEDAGDGDPDVVHERLVRALRDGRVRGDAGRFDFSGLDAGDVAAAPSADERVAALAWPARAALAVLDLLGDASRQDVARILSDEERGAVPDLVRDRLLVPGASEATIRPVSAELARRARASLDPAAWRARAGELLDARQESAWDPAELALLLAYAGRSGVQDALSSQRASSRRDAHRRTARYDELLLVLGDGAAQAKLRAEVGALRAEHRVRTADLERAAEELEGLVVDRDLPAARRIRLRARAGRVALALSRPDVAALHFEEGRRRASRLKRPLDAKTRVLLERGAAYARYRRGDLAGALASLEAVRRAPSNHEALPWIDALYGALAWRGGQPSVARRALERARDVAREVGNDELLATTLQDLVPIDLAEGKTGEARAAVEEARRLRGRLGHVHDEAAIENSRGMVLRESGDLASAADAFAESERLRRRLGDDVGAAAAAGNAASVEALRGDLAGAERRLLSVVDRLEAAGAAIEAEFARIRLAAVAVAAGHHELARTIVSSVESTVPRHVGERELVRARLARADGDDDATLRALRGAREAFCGAGDDVGAARAALAGAELLAAAGDTTGARRWLDGGAGAVTPRLEPMRMRVVGLLAAGSAPEEALSLFLAARDAARSTGLPVERAKAALEAAALLTESSPERAGELVADAALALDAVLLPDDVPPDRKADILLGTRLAQRLDMTHEPSRTPASSGLGGRVTTDGVPDEVFRTFVAINRALQRETDLDRLLTRLLEDAVRLTGGRRGFLLLLRDGRVVFECRSDEVDPASEDVSRTIVLDAVRQARPLLTANARTDPRLQGHRSIEELDLRSVVCAPFRSEGGTQGAVYVDNPIREGAFNARNLDLLEALAGQAAIAIGNLERRQEIERLNAELTDRVERSERALDDVRRRLASEGRPPTTDVVCESEGMKEVFRMLARVAPTDVPVLVLGESGVGKELVARALHDSSRRAEGAFVAENCSAVPESLLESEFFGHVKGAFTGADRDRDGLVSQADGGTLFLDEIGDMPLSLQAKLLRVLQEGTVRPVGAVEPRPVDVRLVCATHRDLAAMVEEKTFREDLYYRIKGVLLRIPPLRQRRADVKALANVFLDRLNEEGETSKRLSRELVARLVAHDWPGNVRELSNEVTRLYHLTEGDELGTEQLELERGGGDRPEGAVVQVKPIHEIERDAIRLALVETGGNREEAARRLEISRAAFYVKLKKYGLSEEVPPSRGRRRS